MLWNGYTTRRDVAIATGPQSEAQRQFFIDASERPDISEFFKKVLTHEQRVEMAQNIGRYNDPQLAKLCTTLLADFDAEARTALAASLLHVAGTHPDAVAAQLNATGSFQLLAISKALSSCGPRAYPLEVKQLAAADARNNAEANLVAAGPAAVPYILPELDNADKDTRLAAADTLGKIGDRAAVAKLEQKLEDSPAEEKPAYISALAGIGDPSTLDLMSGTLRQVALPTQERAQAALGLGRIGQHESDPIAPAKLLWQFASDPDSAVRSNIVQALRMCGDTALEIPGADEKVRLSVASGLTTPQAMQVIGDDLHNGDLRLDAARAAAGRAALAPNLQLALASLDPYSEGEFADALVQSLLTTEPGRKSLAPDSAHPALAGFIQRRKNLAGEG